MDVVTKTVGRVAGRAQDALGSSRSTQLRYRSARNTPHRSKSVKVSIAFPSRFLKATDLNGGAVKDTIVRVVMETVNREEKPLVEFERSKPLVLNKTSALTIASAYGDEMDKWGNAGAELVPALVEFQGAHR
jgi:hypothetical protein